MAFNSQISSRQVDVKNSDTMSEVSESGTSTSGYNSNWGSREELRNFITKHGLKDVSELHQDRFRVDRKSLEQMLSGDNNALYPADIFFTKIMEDTDTYITWPNQLKLGAKSKKDPHVRIAGKPEDVQAAKERIMAILYTRCNRVTMKMDISYTDHSHIIGRGGMSIKRVMEETQCHVHFPDSNRSNPMDKSNQVSISGELEGVECARSRCRELIPLIFGFEPPIMAQNIDNTCPYVIKIQEQYKVQVMFKSRSKLHAIIVLVKGVAWEVEQVKQATLLLMEYMCKDLATQTPVQMSIQISPQHHEVVLGRNHSNLKAIMKYTKCQIMFPDAHDHNIPNLKKSNVTISGNIHNVYNARQLLIGSLPLLVIFDLPEDVSNLRISRTQIAEIQNNWDLTITIRQKTKQTIKSCLIKGIEKHATNIYRAINLILGIDEAPLTADIPLTYHIPSNPPSSPFSNSNHDLAATPTNISPSTMSPFWSPMSPWYNMGQPGQFVGMPQRPQYDYSHMQHNSGNGLEAFSNGLVEQTTKEHTLSSISTNSSGLSSLMPSPRTSTSPHMEMASGTSDYQSMSEKKKPNESLNICDTNYENKRLAAFKAMQTRPSPGSYRIPSSSWSGYGISHTSPAGFGVDPSNSANKVKNDHNIWKPSASTYEANNQAIADLSTSNIVDNTPSHIVNRVTATKWSDLPTLLSSLGLDRYVSLFVQHEVDLDTFATFSNKDLMTIGVSAFGSRKKMLLAISELNRRSNAFSVAPGAERKKSPVNNSGNTTRDNW